MPVKLYLKIVDDFIKYYKDRRLHSGLCAELVTLLTPVCAKIDEGVYDYDKGEGDE